MEMMIKNTVGSLLLNKYKAATPLMIIKSIMYEIGLKYPEYRPCLNKLNVIIYVSQ